MANIWFTSDTHYGHKRIVEYCDRPFRDVREMDEALIENHNKLVKDGDQVFHLGDFAFAPPKVVASIWRRLNGRQFFIRGNHDRWLTSLAKPPNVGWIKDYYELRPEKVVLCHYPLGSWNRMRHGAIMLHGHCHGNYEFGWPNSVQDGKIIDVGVDAMNYRPVPLDTIRKVAAACRWEHIPDHHE